MSDQVFLYLPLQVLEEDAVLNNGRKLPKITFGVNHSDGFENLYNAVDTALETGYRSFDCSPVSSKEEYLGVVLEELLPKHNLQRQDVIITTKILPKDYGMDSTSEAFYHSCEKLKTDYIDLFLMQWPGGECMEPEDEENRCLREDTWKEMVKLSLEGLIKSPGVCHFTCKHLEHIRESSGVIPAVNQVEFHPRCPQVDLLEYSRENNMLLQTTSFKDTFHPLILNDDMVRKVAKCISRTPTQVLMKENCYWVIVASRWAINKGVAVVTEAEKAKKIKQNFHLFDFVLEKPAMDAISSISAREKYLRNPIPFV